MENLHNGGSLLALLLDLYDIEYVFGVPSEAPELVRPLWERASPRYIVLRDERAAPFAANVYTRMSGRVAALEAAPSVGSLLMVPGLAEALNASVPMLAIFTEVSQKSGPRKERGVWNQSTEQMAIVRPAVKYCATVGNVDTLPASLAYALRVATSGRPGPVALFIPADVLAADASAVDLGIVRPELATYPVTRHAPDSASVAQAVAWISESKRPVMLTGGGAILSRAGEEIVGFAENFGVPVATTISGSGVIDETHTLSLGTAGFYGVDSASKVLERADTVIMVGAKGSGYSTWLWRYPRADQRVIRIDVDDADPNQIRYESLTLLGDARAGVAELGHALRSDPSGVVDRSPWLTEVQKMQREWVLRRSESLAISANGPRLCSAKDVVNELEKRLRESDILLCEASATTGWASLIRMRLGAQRIAFRGLGILGGSIGGAVGACLASSSDARVIQLSGDGAMGYQLGEMVTITRLGLKVVSIILNNSSLGAVRIWPGMPPDIADIGEIDFAAAAQACGWEGHRVTDVDQLAPALDAAFSSDRAVLLDVTVDPDEWAELRFRDGQLVPPYEPS